MATWYVYSSGDNSPGYGTTNRDDPTQADNWSNAFQSLATASGSWAAGDTCYVAHDHANTAIAATYTITCPTTQPGIKVICVDRTSGVPVSSYSGEESIPAATIAAMVISGIGYFYGLIFRGRSSLSLFTKDLAALVFEKCKLGTTRTSAAALVYVDTLGTTGGAAVYLNDCDMQLDDSASRISCSGAYLIWAGGNLLAGTETLAAVFTSGTARGNFAIVEGVDFSPGLSTNPVCEGGPLKGFFSHCKATSLAGTSTNQRDLESWGLGAASASPYARGVIDRSGITTDETTVYRTDGAIRGTTRFCQKVITDSDCSRVALHRVRLAEIDTDLSAKTLTVYAARKSAAGAKLLPSECWIDVMYPDDASPLGNIATTRTAPGVAGSAYSDGSKSWQTLTTPYEWKMEVSVASGAAQKGPVTVWLYVAKDLSATDAELYVCPKVTVS